MDRFSELKDGLVLVTGPTGSGKSTTLYASLQEINDRSRNILTVEDPIEYNLPGIGQMLTSAVLGREYMVVQAGVMMTATLFIGVNLLVDLSYPFLDPRLRTRK